MTKPTTAPARGRRADYPTDRLVHELIRAQAAARPGHPAVVAGTGTLRYGDLDRRSDRLAAYLRETAGAGPEVLIGTCLRRSPLAVVALLGIVKSGAVPVLTDPDTSPRRITDMLRDAGARALVSAAGDHGAPADVLGWCAAAGLPAVLLDPDAVDGHDGVDGRLPPAAPRLTPDNAAHVAYTSGSSGGAKGVVARHGAVLQCVYWAREAFALDGADRTTWVSAPGFGISLVNELWPSLATGCTVYLPDAETLLFADRLRDWVLANGITVMQLTRSLAEPLCRLDWPATGSLRLLLVTGEQVERRPPSGLPFRVAITYGSTETTHITSRVDRAADVAGTPQAAGPTPVGRPVANAAIHLLDARGRPVAAGTPGEIHVAGPGLARGYLGAPGLTAARWVPDPFASVPGARRYRTGDVGRLLPDGSLAILGRVDRQIKIRGKRIDLDEVESVLRRRPEVDEAAVTAWGDGDVRRLAAYVTGVDRGQIAGLRAALDGELPAHAVPSAFVLLDALPRNAHGKVDRHALPDPAMGRDTSPAPMRTPGDEVERALVEQWGRLLSLDEVSVSDNFFEVGGHSLIAVQVVTEIEERWGVRVDLPAFYEHPTITDVAAMVRSGRAAGTGGAWLVGAGSVGAGLVGAGPSRRVPSHTRRADRLQLICFPFAGGGPAAFSTWPGLLPPDVDVLCVQPPGRGERLAEPPLRRLDDLVDDLVDALLRADPTAAPTVFFGHSLGAVAAFEVARSLRRRGHPSPDRLLVSGAAAPQTPHTAQVHRMSDEDLLEHTRALGGTPDELLRDPKLRAVVLPALRADFAMHETYRYRPEPPLDCPVTAFAGTDDAEVPPTEAALWRTQTTAGFDLHPLPGGHFFLHSARAALLGLIADALAPLRGAYR